MFKTLLKFKSLIMTYSISTSYLSSKEFLFCVGLIVLITVYHLTYWLVMFSYIYNGVV